MLEMRKTICYPICTHVLAGQPLKGDSAMTHNTSDWSLPEEKIITPDQLRRILDVARQNERDYVFFATGANVGIRLCEIAHIQREDVQGDKLTIVRRKKKNLTASRIDLVPAFAEILNQWAERVEYGYIFPGNCSPCIIKRRSGEQTQVCPGGHVSLRAIQRRWELVIAEAGLRVPGRGIHSLRHYAVSQFYAKTRDLRACQVFAGHSSSQITERYASPVDLRDQVRSMEAIL